MARRKVMIIALEAGPAWQVIISLFMDGVAAPLEAEEMGGVAVMEDPLDY